MKIFKRIIYSLLGLLLTGAVVLVGVILFAEYSGQRFSPSSTEAASQAALSDDESRLVYDENGNLAELPAGVPMENTDSETTDDTANGTVPSPATTQETTTATSDASSDSGERLYIMDLGSNLFHTEDCPYAANISEENRSEMTTTRDKIMTAGYQTCTNCNP